MTRNLTPVCVCMFEEKSSIWFGTVYVFYSASLALQTVEQKQLICGFSDFYNWNRVKVRYCDGASFSGDVEAVDPVSHIVYNPGTFIRFSCDFRAKNFV